MLITKICPAGNVFETIRQSNDLNSSRRRRIILETTLQRLAACHCLLRFSFVSTCNWPAVVAFCIAVELSRNVAVRIHHPKSGQARSTVTLVVHVSSDQVCCQTGRRLYNRQPRLHRIFAPRDISVGLTNARARTHTQIRVGYIHRSPPSAANYRRVVIVVVVVVELHALKAIAPSPTPFIVDTRRPTSGSAASALAGRPFHPSPAGRCLVDAPSPPHPAAEAESASSGRLASRCVIRARGW